MLAWTAALAMMGADPPSGAGQAKPPAERFDWRRAWSWILPRKANPPAPAPKIEAKAKEPERPSDALLQLRCQSEVFADRELRASPMRVEVRDGVAHLRGRVESQRLSDRADLLAKRTPGVDAVENELTVDAAIAEKPLDAVGDPTPKRRGRLTPIPGLQPSSENESAVARTPFERPTGDIVVSRPRVLPRGDDDAAVTTYAIRRMSKRRDDSASVLAPAAAVATNDDLPSAKSNRTENPGKRPGLVRLPADALAAPAPATPKSVAPELTAVGKLLNSDPRAAGVQFRETSTDVTLFGTAASATDLFGLVADLEALPGAKRIWLDRENMQVGKSAPKTP